MTPSAFSIRRAASHDASGLLGLVEEYWRFEGIAGFDTTRVETALERLLSDDARGAGWIASRGDEPLGYLLAVYVFSLEHLGLTAEIDELYVRPEARSAGVGGRLIRTAEDAFRSLGCTNVSLQLGRGNDRARAFYQRRGYRPRAGYELLDKSLP